MKQLGEVVFQKEGTKADFGAVDYTGAGYAADFGCNDNLGYGMGILPGEWGFDSGKKAASAILAVRKAVIDHLKSNQGTAQTASQIAEAIGQSEKTTWIFKILENLAVNQANTFERISTDTPLEDQFLAS